MISAFFVACNKDEAISFNPNDKLSFSTDSVLFDTVFTAVGSTTRRFQIFNFNKKALFLNKIELGGKNNSPFSININGRNINELIELTINGNDSVNVLVRVNINPNLSEQPFIVEDSLIFQYNGNRKVVPLVAYGQNAIFIDNILIKNDTTWDSKLPYIIKKSVTIAEGKTLNIAPGTKLLFHKDALMKVNGTLVANGNKTDSILFASDRLERIYQEEPGQWTGIQFSSTSKNSIINHATIKNAITGIAVDSMSNDNIPKLTLANSVVKNMQIVGFLGYHTNFAAYNNLFYNCGQYLVYGVGGGNYEFIQNTLAAFNFSFARRTAALTFSNSNGATQSAALKLSFTNNIIWGSLDDELLIENKANPPIEINFKNNLIKTKSNVLENDNILNKDPKFASPRLGNFNLSENSPALNYGLDIQSHPMYNSYLKWDINHKLRSFPSDLGCSEKE